MTISSVIWSPPFHWARNPSDLSADYWAIGQSGRKEHPNCSNAVSRNRSLPIYLNSELKSQIATRHFSMRRMTIADVLLACMKCCGGQGLLEGLWCLDESEGLSPGQIEEINRVYTTYPHLNDDTFVAEHRDEWLSG